MSITGIGTVINVIAIVTGGTIGMLVGRRFSDALRVVFMDALGLITMVSAVQSVTRMSDQSFADAVPAGATLLVVLAAMLIGGGIGFGIRLEQRLESVGDWLRRRFAREGDHTFVEGFVMSSLIFVIGPLAIMGSISDGLGNGIDQLTLKSALDLIAAVAFASALGLGVVASAIPVGIYQGVWTVIGVFLGNIMNDAQVAAMTATGGLLLAGISLKLLNLKQVPVGTFLPALFVAPLLLVVL